MAHRIIILNQSYYVGTLAFSFRVLFMLQRLQFTVVMVCSLEFCQEVALLKQSYILGFKG